MSDKLLLAFEASFRSSEKIRYMAMAKVVNYFQPYYMLSLALVFIL